MSTRILDRDIDEPSNQDMSASAGDSLAEVKAEAPKPEDITRTESVPAPEETPATPESWPRRRITFDWLAEMSHVRLTDIPPDELPTRSAESDAVSSPRVPSARDVLKGDGVSVPLQEESAPERDSRQNRSAPSPSQQPTIGLSEMLENWRHPRAIQGNVRLRLSDGGELVPVDSDGKPLSEMSAQAPDQELELLVPRARRWTPFQEIGVGGLDGKTTPEDDLRTVNPGRRFGRGRPEIMPYKQETRIARKEQRLTALFAQLMERTLPEASVEGGAMNSDSTAFVVPPPGPPLPGFHVLPPSSWHFDLRELFMARARAIVKTYLAAYLTSADIVSYDAKSVLSLSFYIDNVTDLGFDTNSGRSELDPWQSFWPLRRFFGALELALETVRTTYSWLFEVILEGIQADINLIRDGVWTVDQESSYDLTAYLLIYPLTDAAMGRAYSYFDGSYYDEYGFGYSIFLKIPMGLTGVASQAQRVVRTRPVAGSVTRTPRRRSS